MKKLISKILILIAFTVNIKIAFAQTITNCKDSFAPQFICQQYADITNNLSVTSILSLILDILMAILVIFIIWQIIKAVFAWVNKSSDDKSRGAAIKSISNAIVAGIVLLILLVVLFVGSNILGIGNLPNVLYACYDNNVISGLIAQGTYPVNSAMTINTNINLKEIPDVYVYEGVPYHDNGHYVSGAFWHNNNYNDTYNELTLIPNADSNYIEYASSKLICKDRNTGKEYEQGYVILKRVGVQK